MTKKEPDLSINIRSTSIDTINKNTEERSIVFCASTGAKVNRVTFFGDKICEELEISENSVDLSRLNKGAPLLIDHNAGSVNNQMGVIEKAWVENNRLYVRARFSRKPEAEIIYQDVLDKIIRNVSIGYMVNSYEKTKEENSETFNIKVTNFTPFEVSLVTIPADSEAGIRNLYNNIYKNNNNKTQEEGEKRMEPVVAEEGKKVIDPVVAEEGEKTNNNANNEQERILQIITYCSQRNIDIDQMQKIIKDTITLDEAKIRIADIILNQTKENIVKNELNRNFNSFEDQNKNIRYNPVTSTGHDENLLMRQGVENALMFRAKHAIELTENGKRFYNLSLVEICRKMIAGSDYLKNDELYRRAITTTDLPNILLNINNKEMMKKYNDINQTFRPLVREVEVANLKIQTELQVGTFPALPDAAENEEFKMVSFSESKETYRITKHGIVFPVTEEMIINDDLNVIMRTPAMFARATAEKESNLLWAQLADTKMIMNDGKPVFHKDHFNIAEKGSLLTNSAITEALVAMKKQKGLDNEELFLNKPKYLITTTQNKERALRLLTPIAATKPEDINIYAGQFELIIEDRIAKLGEKAFIFASTPQDIDGLIFAYLKGQRGAQIKRHEEWRTNTIAFECKLFAGAKALDYRGYYLNPGV